MPPTALSLRDYFAVCCAVVLVDYVVGIEASELIVSKVTAV